MFNLIFKGKARSVVYRKPATRKYFFEYGVK
jgi:hypothetical protein